MKKLVIGLLILFLVIEVFPQYHIPLNQGPTKTQKNSNDESTEELVFTFNYQGVNALDIETKKGDFTKLFMDGSYRTGRIGEPELPSSKKLIEIPYGSAPEVEILSYDIEEYSLADYGINKKVIPAQPSYSKNTDPALEEFKHKTDIYSKDEYLNMGLSSVKMLGTLRGISIAQLTVNPIQYNPVQNTIRVYNNVKVQVKINGGTSSYNNYIKSISQSPYYNTIYNAIDNSTKSSGSDYPGYEDHTNYPIKYLIVTAPEFEPELTEFIDWKTKKGFKVITANTDDIGSSVSEIKTWIQDQFMASTESDPAPSFLLLVGDVAQIPASQNGVSTARATDLYYACMDGEGDIFPDMYYGRLSAQNTTQLGNMVDKILYYEKYEFSDDSYLNDVTLIAGADGTYNAAVGQPTIKYGTDNYFNTANGFSTVNQYLSSYSGCYDNERIQVGLINYTAHCGTTSWSNPYLSQSAVNNFQNSGKYPFAIANCCESGNYSISECIGETWMRKADGGAVAYIGSSPYTYWHEDFYWSVGAHPYISGNYPTVEGSTLGAYDAPYLSDYLCVDAIRFVGNLAVTEALDEGYTSSVSARYYWEAYNCLSDPSINVYLTSGSDNVVSHANSIGIGLDTYEVSAEPGSYVGISKDGSLLGAALVPEAGTVIVPIIPVANSGNVDIVVTKAQYKPYINQVPAEALTGTYLALDKIKINDESGNGTVDYSETFSIELYIKNVGTDLAQEVKASITTDDNYVESISENLLIDCNDIAAESIASITGNFNVKVKDSVPDQHQIIFNIELSDNSVSKSTYNYERKILINAPSLEISSTFILDDSEFDNNGILDANETAKLIVNVTNTGHAQVSTTTELKLINQNPYLTIENDTYNHGNILAGGSSNAEFTIHADAATPDSSIAILKAISIDINTNAYKDSTELEIQMCVLPELIIGDGSTEAVAYPFNNYYENNKTQILYLQSELGNRAKTIMELAFDISNATANAIYRDLANFSIRMMHSDATALSNYVDMSNAQLIYSKEKYDLTGLTGWENFELDSSFIYNGTSNIIIEIVWGDNGEYVPSQTYQTKVNSTYTTNNTVAYGRSDTETPPYFDGTSTVRPNLKMVLDKAYALKFVAIDADANPMNYLADVEISLNDKQIETNEMGEATFAYSSPQIGLNYTTYLEGYYSSSGTLNLETDLVVDTLKLKAIPKYNIDFWITNNEENLENALVEFNNQSGFTNSGGHIVFEVYEAESMAYIISKTDYLTNSGFLNANQSKTISIDLKSIIIAPEIVQISSMTDQRAEVTWNGVNSGSKAFESYNLYLNDLVNPIATNLNDTSYILSALTNGAEYIVGVEAIYTSATSAIESLSFYYTELFNVEFNIEDAKGAIDNATIVFNEVIYTSNTEGKYNFNSESALNIPYQIVCNGYYTIFDTLNLIADTSLSIVINEIPDLTFRIFNSENNTLKNATVNLNGQSILSDEYGECTFTNIDTSATQIYTVTIQNYLSYTDSLKVLDKDTSIKVQLHLLPTVTFNITDVNGNALDNTKVYFNDLINLTDKDGKTVFEFVEPANELTIKIVKDTYFTYYDTINLSAINIDLNIKLFEIPDVTFSAQANSIPVQNLTIEFGNLNLTTDKFGMVTFQDVTPGTYVYRTIDEECYSISDSITIDSNNTSVSLNLKMIPDLTLSISDGLQLIENAKVIFNNTSYYSDKEGNVVLNNIKAGTYPYTVTKDNYYEITDSIKVDAFDVNEMLILKLIQFNVSLLITDNKQPLQNAIVTLNNTTKLSDIEGKALFNNIEFGNGYSYSVSKNGYYLSDGQIDVNDNLDIEIPLEIISYNITFNVLDKNGAIENAKVSLGDSTQVTDQNGEALFGKILPENSVLYRIEAQSHNSVNGTIDIDSDESLDVTLFLVDVNNSNELQVLAYPNPTSGIIYVNINKPDDSIIIRIIDESGRIIQQLNKPKQINTIDLSSYAKGLYFITIEGKDLKFNEKLILE